MTLEFDESILPGFAEETPPSQFERVCIPGTQLFPCPDGYRAGSGCYERDGHIYASAAGSVHVFEPGDSASGPLRVVEVQRKRNQRVGLIPCQGCIVTARVEAITLRYAKCSIICVEETMLRHEFNSTLRKEDIREREKDKVEIYRCVQPGDIILARVLGYGDSQSAYLLSIAEDTLGVIFGRGQNGEKMVPESGEQLVKDITGNRLEERKVAIVGAAAHPIVEQ